MTTDTKINGRVKFYNKEKGFGFITTEDKKEFYFNSSDLIQNYIPRTNDDVYFFEKKIKKNVKYSLKNTSNTNKTEKNRACFVQPYAYSKSSKCYKYSEYRDDTRAHGAGLTDKYSEYRDHTSSWPTCPRCERKIIPRWYFYRGTKEYSYCPFCGKVIEYTLSFKVTTCLTIILALLLLPFIINHFIK